MTNQPTDQPTVQPADDATTPWYVIHTKPRRELLVTSQLEGMEALTVFLPEVIQHGAGGAQPHPLFPSYLFVQVDLQSSAAGKLIHTPGVIGLVGSERQPTPVAAATIQALQERVQQVNAGGGLLPHTFQVGDLVTLKAGPLQGLDAVFVGPLTPSRRVQILLQFLGQQQQVEVDVRLLEKGNQPPQPQAERRPRRSRGQGRLLHANRPVAHDERAQKERCNASGGHIVTAPGFVAGAKLLSIHASK